MGNLCNTNNKEDFNELDKYLFEYINNLPGNNQKNNNIENNTENNTENSIENDIFNKGLKPPNNTPVSTYLRSNTNDIPNI